MSHFYVPQPDSEAISGRDSFIRETDFVLCILVSLGKVSKYSHTYRWYTNSKGMEETETLQRIVSDQNMSSKAGNVYLKL